jgi:hypothetical protein
MLTSRDDAHDAAPEVGGLPAFITGGGQPQPAAGQPAAPGGNGHDQGDRPDRFGRRRRRHRSGSNFRPDRPDFNGNTQDAAPAEGGGEPPPQAE